MPNKKSNLKRFLSLFFALMFVLLTVAGCNPGNNETPSDTTASGETSSGNTEAAGDGPVYGGILDVVNQAEGAQPLGVPWENTTNDTSLLQPLH